MILKDVGGGGGGFAEPVPTVACPHSFLVDRMRTKCTVEPFDVLCVLRGFSIYSDCKHGYVSYSSLPVSFHQSGHSPLTSLINTMFSPTELPLTGSSYFVF